MVASTSALTWFFVGVFLYGSCSPVPLDDLNINLNIKENNKQKGIDEAVRPTGRNSKPTEGLCFEYDIHYVGLPLNNTWSTGSALGCRLLCQKTYGCFWFNWEKPTDMHKDRCWLKKGKGDYIAKHPGAVTGPRDCPSELTCPTLHVNLQLRRDWEALKPIGSPNECAKKCRDKTTCNFWTWSHLGAGEFALDCKLMSDYGYSNLDTNVITGHKSCFVPANTRMNAQCDDSNMKLFADGNLLATRDHYVTDQSIAVPIPTHTKIIQIDCENTAGMAGIVASSTGGILTNNAWVCSSDNGTTWNPAYQIKDNDGWGYHPNGSVDGIRPEAKWIWTGKDDWWEGKQMAISCKIDLDSCFEYDIHYVGEALNKPGTYTNNYGITGDAQACQLLCQNTNGCGWFNWAKKTHTSSDQCFLERRKGDEIEQHPGDVTGPRSCMRSMRSTRSTRSMRRDPDQLVETAHFSPAVKKRSIPSGVRVDNYLTAPIFGSVSFLVSLVCPSLEYGPVEPKGFASLSPAGMCLITRLTAYYIEDGQPKYCTPYKSAATAHNRFKVMQDDTDSRNPGSCRVVEE